MPQEKKRRLSLRDFFAKVRRKTGTIKTEGLIVAGQFFFGLRNAWLYRFHKKNSIRRFFILCQQRTGSSLLMTYLNSIPQVSCAAEVLSRIEPHGIRRWWISKKIIFRHVRYVLNYRCQEVQGAKIFFVDLAALKLPLEEFIREFPEAQWIVLYRKDILAQLLSKKIALQTDTWSRYENSSPVPDIQITLRTDEALKYRDWVKTCYQTALENPFLRKQSLWISYEELVKNPQALFDGKIFPFLKLAKHPVQTALIKQNLRSPSEVIANYHEVRDVIEHTDFTQTYP